DSAGIAAGNARYRGYIDEIKVWHRALAPKEIAEHYSKRADALVKLETARRADLFAQFARHGVEEIVFAERGYGRDLAGHYYANFGYSCVNPNVWFHAADRGRLTKLNIRTGELTVLVDDPGGSVRDPRVHYDGNTILFSYRKGGTHRYHLYEINTDGTDLRQITDGPWDDVEPTYLPDGNIVFCSTRCKRWIGCWLAEAAILFRCDRAGGNMEMLSSGSFTENTPAVLNDGRILYTRWEYVNRDPVSFHHLWTMYPDGSGQMVYFGNMRRGSVFIDAAPIPGSNRIVLINSPGHGRNEHQGYVATATGAHGPNARSSMKNISKTADFRDPYPLSEQTLLVSRGNQILLMNSQGETAVVHQGGTLPVHEPRPIRRRRRESIIPHRTHPNKTTATLLISNVYSGRKMADVEPGNIKKLLVMEDLPKPANFHGGGSQPLGHGVSSTLKRILGTVPVELDGSACFKVPAKRSIYFALLGEKDESVKQMRSFVTLAPGETVGCVGCHEQRQNTSNHAAGRRPLALDRQPSRIEPIRDVPEIMDFPRDIQPILDKHCVKCHNHRQRDGGLALLGDHGPVFSHSYYSLYLHWQIKDTATEPRHGTGRQTGNDKPYTTYSSASALMDKLEQSHYDVRLSAHEKKMIRLWIDTGATYAGTYAAYGTGQVGGCWRNNEPIREMADDWPSTPAAQDAVRRRCGSCHRAEQLAQHVTAQVATDHGDMLSWTRPLSRYSRHNIYNLTRPDKSLILLAGLSRNAGGYAAGKSVIQVRQAAPVKEDRTRPPISVEHPIVFEDANDPDYRKILTHITAAKAKLEEIKRFDMPGFRPNEHYVREMKRYGIIANSV
ncbi:MAG: HzsA-related protein, partial [Planctomycetota bacterium]